MAHGHVCGDVLVAEIHEERAPPKVGGSFFYFVSFKVGSFADIRTGFFRLPK